MARSLEKGASSAHISLPSGLDETTEVGCDVGEPVSEDYGPRGNEFNGEVKWVQIDVDAAAKDVDHMIGAEERFMVAMARQ
jgi:hypothetical protein